MMNLETNVEVNEVTEVGTTEVNAEEEAKKYEAKSIKLQNRICVCVALVIAALYTVLTRFIF